MGRRSLLCWFAVACIWVLGCKGNEARIERIEIAPDHRSCAVGEACGVVETSCASQGCECGVAVNEGHLIEYQKQLAECRGQDELTTCDFECKTPFGKCFKGACVLTSEPAEVFRAGRSVQALCESSRGSYVGCPQCPPGKPCKSCMPCTCRSSDRWTRRGCRAVLKTEARDIRVEVRPPMLSLDEKSKTRVHNGSRHAIWLKTACGMAFYRLRKKEDAWEKRYEPFQGGKCREGSVKIDPGESRPFVISNLKRFRASSGEAATPGRYRFELTYTDGNDSFRYSAPVYSAEFDIVPKTARN